MSSHPHSSFTKPCHNCRRRRIVCDRSVPVCQKCIKAGEECMGYGKRIVWAQGVASRGKMKGKTFQEVQETVADTKHPKQQGYQDPLSLSALPSSSSLAFSSTLIPVPSASTDVVLGRNAPAAVAGVAPAFEANAQSVLILQNSSSGRYDRDEWDNENYEFQILLPQTLTDPFLQDLHPNLRRYVFHFSNYLSVDIMLYDMGRQNPVRNLIPTAAKHPVLMQIIIAASAFHIFNLCRRSLSIKDSSVSGPKKKTTCWDKVIEPNTSTNALLRTSYKDSLLAKQNALRLLNNALANLENEDLDIVLASVLLFIDFELIESGMDSWKVHIEGAKSLIGIIEASCSAPGNISFGSSSMDFMKKCLISDCLVYVILGSLLTYSVPSTPPARFNVPVDLDSLLECAESYNYLSCPAELLRVLLQASELSHTAYSILSNGLSLATDYYEQIWQLLQAAQGFDPHTWAANLSPDVSPSQDMQSRAYVASAHRSAVSLYILRILPFSCNLPQFYPDSTILCVTDLVTDIIYHLSHIPSTDPLFKSTSWPTFIAGAEAMNPLQRAWIKDRFEEMWELLQWGYFRSSLEVLQMIWSKKPSSFSDLEDQWNSTNWVEEIGKHGTSLFIV